jgi:Bacteriophage holin of superfamily 6 (Holin_LLH)
MYCRSYIENNRSCCFISKTPASCIVHEKGNHTMPTWFQIAIVILPIVLPPLTAVAALVYQRMLQGLPAQKRAIVEQIVNTVVPAIEQTAASTVSNPEKKKAAMDLASSMLDHLNVSVPPEMLSGMIEATVFALNQSKNAQVVVAQASPLAANKVSAG